MYKIKKYIKVIFLVIIFLLLSGQLNVFATTAGDNLINEISTGTNTFMSMGGNQLNEYGINSIEVSFLAGFGNILFVIGYVILLAYAMIKGVRWAYGNPGDLAKLKKDFLIWLVICFVILGSKIIVELIAASFGGGPLMEDIINQFDGVSQGLSTDSQNSTFMMIVNTLLRVVQVAAIGGIIIHITILGIRYFTLHVTAKDAETKAQIKGRLVRGLIYAIIIFGAAGLVDLLYRVLN